MGRIIDKDKSVIPACDVPVDTFVQILEGTKDVEGIGGYKVGFDLMLNLGLDEALQEFTSDPKDVYYNHLSGCTDIPDVGEKFMSALEGRVKGAVLSPLTGPATFSKWLDAAEKHNIDVIVEPLLGNPDYLSTNRGFITPGAVEEMCFLAVDKGVTKFILPPSFPGWFQCTKESLPAGVQFYTREDGYVHGLSEITSIDVIPHGLGAVVDTANKILGKDSGKVLIYDHQKAATAHPDWAEEFVSAVYGTGIDTMIMFPMAGPLAEETWIDAANDKCIHVIVGGLMTHPEYTINEGGYLRDKATFNMYRIAAERGISDFVVPGNKPDKIRQIKKVIEEIGITPVFYAPGFVAQGGQISEGGKAAGEFFHAIVGRGIYKAEDVKVAAVELTKNL